MQLQICRRDEEANVFFILITKKHPNIPGPSLLAIMLVTIYYPHMSLLLSSLTPEAFLVSEIINSEASSITLNASILREEVDTINTIKNGKGFWTIQHYSK